MKRSHANNSTGRILAKGRRYSVGILLITLIAFGLSSMLPVSSHRKPGQGYGKEMEVPAGVDLLKTVPGVTRFTFRDEFTIPADFFDKGSRPFAGTVSLKGAPIGSYRDQKTGDADTVIERTQSASFSSGTRSASVPIEVAVLSLESTKPISVRVGRKWQQWNVKFGLSPSRKSGGTLSLMRNRGNGGTFNSEFVVYGLITFTRKTDGAQKSLDIGSMNLDEKSIAKITLRTTGAPWSQSPSRSGANAGFRAGATSAVRVVSFSESSQLANHGVRAVIQ